MFNQSTPLAGLRYQSVNLHSHSTASDGQKTPRQIEAFARERGIIVAITDHNTVAAHEEIDSPHILAGVEVRAGSAGIEVLVYGERTALLHFFRDAVEPYLREENPCYAPIRRSIMDVMHDAYQCGLYVILPHYAAIAGIGMLEERDQRRIAQWPVFVELNGQLSAKRNAKARAFAEAMGLPIIAADDTHWGDYSRTLTHILLPTDTAPTVKNLVHGVREYAHHCRLDIQEPTVQQSFRTARQIQRSIGSNTMLVNATAKTFFFVKTALRPELRAVRY